ncbi:hypothetical protein V7156_24370, partial [Priestia megaterium]
MSIKKAVQQLWSPLWHTGKDHIINSYIETQILALKYSKTKKAQEPDYIAILVERVGKLAKDWDMILSTRGITLSIASVYCHQRPIVKYSSNGINPEIGDLLIVHAHHPKKGRSRRRAILLQAKMVTDISEGINPNDHQLYLYERWPVFKFIKPRKAGTRQVTPTQAHMGGRYLMIADPSSSFLYNHKGYEFMTAASSENLNAEYHFLNEIMGILDLSKGKEFHGRKTAEKRSDWSTVIWELLEISFRKNLKRKNIGKFSSSRLSGNRLSGFSGLCFSYKGSRAQCSILEEILGKEESNRLYSESEDIKDIT